MRTTRPFFTRGAEVSGLVISGVGRKDLFSGDRRGAGVRVIGGEGDGSQSISSFASVAELLSAALRSRKAGGSVRLIGSSELDVPSIIIGSILRFLAETGGGLE